MMAFGGTPSQGGFSLSPPRRLVVCDLATRNEALSQYSDPLEALANLVPWETFRQTLEAVLHRSKQRKGDGLSIRKGWVDRIDPLDLMKPQFLRSPMNTMSHKHWLHRTEKPLLEHHISIILLVFIG